MNFKRNISLIFCIIFISIIDSSAQIRIVNSDYKQIFGFVLEENETLVKLISIKDENLNILKSDIKLFEKVEVTLLLKNKLKIRGNITERNDSSFSFINSDSIKSTVLFTNISRIFTDEHDLKEYLNNLIFTKIKQIENKFIEKKISYRKVGLSVGTPGGINVDFGSTNQNTAFNFNIGMAGIQIGLGRNLVSSQYFELNILINLSYLLITEIETGAYGYQSNKKDLKFCIGPLMDINILGINIQAGLGITLSAKPIIPVFMQIGFNYRYPY